VDQPDCGYDAIRLPRFRADAVDRVAGRIERPSTQLSAGISFNDRDVTTPTIYATQTSAPFTCIEADEELIRCSVGRADQSSAQCFRQPDRTLSVAVEIDEPTRGQARDAACRTIHRQQSVAVRLDHGRGRPSFVRALPQCPLRAFFGTRYDDWASFADTQVDSFFRERLCGSRVMTFCN
jgi:hypothetical protein